MTASILTFSEIRHLHVVGELLEGPPVFAAQREVERFDLQEIVTGLELGRGEGYGGTTANPMSGDVPNLVGDVL